MRERPNRMVSKTIVAQVTLGSNPSPSALFCWSVRVCLVARCCMQFVSSDFGLSAGNKAVCNKAVLRDFASLSCPHSALRLSIDNASTDGSVLGMKLQAASYS